MHWVNTSPLMLMIELRRLFFIPVIIRWITVLVAMILLNCFVTIPMYIWVLRYFASQYWINWGILILRFR